ncbi:MAG: formylglycine-generating enzyme family protein [Deltaproteobacteria bacterium]|nr:formylglycine-generating enzyme family protein [Deltaproteobacteria bacterium]
MTRLAPAGALLCLATAGCSAWIDDFSVGDSGQDAGLATDSETGTATDADADADADSDTDTDTDVDADTDADSDTSDGSDSSDSDSDTDTSGPACGVFVTPPSGDDLELCTVAPEAFFMGCDGDAAGEDCVADELPMHEVVLSGYEIARFETTNAAFASFVDDQPSWAKDGALAAQKCGSNYLSDWQAGEPVAGMEQRPVTGVCWHAAKAFCQWLGDGFDLPTEARWEHAARGTHDGRDGSAYWMYAFGNAASCDLANFSGCVGGPADVGTATGMAPSGAYDMSGNVWEWVQDWYRSDIYCDPTNSGAFVSPQCNEGYEWADPEGDADGALKGVRGGSWFHEASIMRNAKRQGLEPRSTSNLIGFRCAR